VNSGEDVRPGPIRLSVENQLGADPDYPACIKESRRLENLYSGTDIERKMESMTDLFSKAIPEFLSNLELKQYDNLVTYLEEKEYRKALQRADNLDDEIDSEKLSQAYEEQLKMAQWVAAKSMQNIETPEVYGEFVELDEWR
jgi:hypothetical protein